MWVPQSFAHFANEWAHPADDPGKEILSGRRIPNIPQVELNLPTIRKPAKGGATPSQFHGDKVWASPPDDLQESDAGDVLTLTALHSRYLEISKLYIIIRMSEASL